MNFAFFTHELAHGITILSVCAQISEPNMIWVSTCCNRIAKMIVFFGVKDDYNRGFRIANHKLTNVLENCLTNVELKTGAMSPRSFRAQCTLTVSLRVFSVFIR